MVKKWYSNGEDLKEHNPKTIDKPRLFKETKSNMKLGIDISRAVEAPIEEIFIFD